MADSVIYAGKAAVGGQYLTKGGVPVRVDSITERGVVVTDLLFLWQVSVGLDVLLWPYQKDHINKEAIIMARATKAAGSKSKSGKVKEAGNGSGSVEKTEAGTIILVKVMRGGEQRVQFRDGVFRHDGKVYETLREAAAAVAGRDVSGSGRSFFKLRRPENAAYLKEIEAGVKAAKKARDEEKEKARKDAKAAKKTTRKKAADEDEDEPAKAAKSSEPAVMSSRSRGR